MKALVQFIFLILFFFSCRKEAGRFELTGRFIDDVTGKEVKGRGTIRVIGHNIRQDFLMPINRDVGKGLVDGNGCFTARFTPWKDATDYSFSFSHTNEQYYYFSLLTLDKDNFIEGKTDITIRIPIYTKARINFRNKAPFDNNDRLTISLYPWGYPALDVQWENLQSCEVRQDVFIYGGINAQGVVTADVPADRRILIGWQVRKNGTYKEFQDTFLCPRNTVTNYDINY